VEFRAVRSFVAVADAGSVTAAAQDLRVAQPSLSRQLQRFERELGLALFDRRDKRLVLTAAGRRFLPIARDLVTREQLAREAASALREGALSSIVLSAPGTTLTDVIAPFLATWMPDDPVPEVWAQTPAEIYGSLERGADLAIGTEPPPKHLRHRVIAQLPVWASIHRDHPWSGRDSVSLAELVEQRLLLLGPGQHARTALDRALARVGIPLGSFIEFGVPEVAQAVASARRGVAVVSDDPRFDLSVRPIETPDGHLRITLYAAWTRSHHAESTVADLARRLQTFCQGRYPGHDLQA
jgi:DNA-binding transcriptional LysR family regulator